MAIEACHGRCHRLANSHTYTRTTAPPRVFTKKLSKIVRSSAFDLNIGFHLNRKCTTENFALGVGAREAAKCHGNGGRWQRWQIANVELQARELLEGVDGAYAGVCCIFHRNLKCMKRMKRMQRRAVRDSALEAW